MSFRILVSRFLKRSTVVGLVALIFFLVILYVDVKSGKSAALRSAPIGVFGLAAVFFAFCAAAWPTFDEPPTRRVIGTLLSSIISFLVWGIILLLVGYPMHFAFGGAE